MDADIRRICPGEGDLLRQIRLQALKSDPDAFASTYERALSRTAEEWEDAASSAARGDNQFLAVAVDSGSFVGMAGGFIRPETPMTGHLYGMWVAPESRSRGIGFGLTNAVVDWAREIEAEELTLWVVETNRPALALYERAGFKTTDVKQPLPSNPDSMETRMVLHLR